MRENPRRIRYSVAMSLDGFIADREGGYGWIVDEPGIDFAAYVAKIDTLLMGRGTYETALSNPGGLSMFEMEVHVVSTTLRPDEAPGVNLIADDVEGAVRELKARDGRKDIWLFGGGVLFRSLLEARLVDRVEVGVVPVLLGEGVPLLPGLGRSSARTEESTGSARPATAPLTLHSVERFGSGMVLAKYDVD